MIPRLSTVPFGKYTLQEIFLEERFESVRTLTALVVGSAALAVIFVLSYGSFFIPLALLGMLVVILITFYRLDWGLMLFIAAVLLFDQVPPRGYEQSIFGTEYFENLKALSFLSSVDLAVVNPLELHLLLLLIVWIFLIILGKKVVLQRVPVWFTAIVFFVWLTFAAIHGIGRGGDFLASLWELRALFYLGCMYFFVPQIIQSKDQLQNLLWVCILCISFKALQGLVRIVNLGFKFGYRTELTNHEDPLFFVSLFVLLFGLTLNGSNTKQRRFLQWIMLPMLFVFILAQRRATYGAFAVAMVAFMVLITKEQRLKLLKGILPVLLIFATYLAAFWNSDISFGYTAQLVKSSFSSDQKMTGERYESNLYREFENYNLSMTIRRAPLIGIGFGNKYDQPISLAAIPFSLRDYIPHNEIFWLAVKSGAIGFFFFWFFFDAFVFQAACVFSRISDPYLKSICAMTIVAVLGQIIVSYFDLQLTFYRNMIYLGMLMGLLPTLEMLNAHQAEENFTEGQKIGSSTSLNRKI